MKKLKEKEGNEKINKMKGNDGDEANGKKEKDMKRNGRNLKEITMK
jgi:hypothetical protein